MPGSWPSPPRDRIPEILSPSPWWHAAGVVVNAQAGRLVGRRRERAMLERLLDTAPSSAAAPCSSRPSSSDSAGLGSTRPGRRAGGDRGVHRLEVVCVYEPARERRPEAASEGARLRLQDDDRRDEADREDCGRPPERRGIAVDRRCPGQPRLTDMCPTVSWRRRWRIPCSGVPGRRSLRSAGRR
jgi:hypothetical protein